MADENVASLMPTEELAVPPPAPRVISDKYAWRLLLTEGWGIAALVFGLLGVIFSFVGAGLTLGIITAFVGIPFLFIGLTFLAGAIAVGKWRYDHAQQVVNVLRVGVSTRGKITDVEKNYSVRVNGRSPWMIRYQFQLNGQDYEGQVSTLNAIGTSLQTGKTVYILYLPNAPQLNSIYPHP